MIKFLDFAHISNVGFSQISTMMWNIYSAKLREEVVTSLKESNEKYSDRLSKFTIVLMFLTGVIGIIAMLQLYVMWMGGSP